MRLKASVLPPGNCQPQNISTKIESHNATLVNLFYKQNPSLSAESTAPEQNENPISFSAAFIYFWRRGETLEDSFLISGDLFLRPCFSPPVRPKKKEEKPLVTLSWHKYSLSLSDQPSGCPHDTSWGEGFHQRISRLSEPKNVFNMLLVVFLHRVIFTYGNVGCRGLGKFYRSCYSIFFAVFSAAAAIPLRRGIGKRRVRGGKLFCGG